MLMQLSDKGESLHMSKHTTISRRGFLSALGLGAGALATAALPSDAARASAGPTGLASADHELCTLIDLSVCIGCGACVEACREANAHKFPEPKKPFPEMFPKRVKVEDWSDRREVDDRLTPYNWLFLQTVEVEHRGESFEISVPRRCLHCVNPPCANLCPWGSARKEDNGIVRIDADFCLGGAKCRNVCPWGVPQRQTGVGLYLDLLPRFAGNGVMYKCDRCHDRVAVGKQPACIEACPVTAQVMGPRADILAEAERRAAAIDGCLYGHQENGGANTVYVSPVPFEAIQAALEATDQTGPGRPHMRPVEDVMAAEHNLAAAVALAPIAGVAAGVAAMLGKDKGGDDA